MVGPLADSETDANGQKKVKKNWQMANIAV